MGEVIQGLWIGRPLSAIERLSIASFLQHGHEYHLYCYDDVGDVPPGVRIKDGNEILPASEIFSYQHGPSRGSLSAFSNLFRYKLLLARGGWWADTDVVCLRAFEFDFPALFASEQTPGKAKLATAVIRLTQGNLVAARCYEIAKSVDRATLQWGQIGPDLLTRVVAEEGFPHPAVKPEVFCPIPWWEWRSLIAEDPRAAEGWVTRDSYAVHLWHECWRREALGEAQRFPGSSFFARLLERYGIA